MFSIPLLKKETKSNYKIFLIFLSVLAMYTFIIVSMFNPEMEKMLEEFSKVMPEIMSAVGMGNPGTTLVSFMATYLYGFLALIFPLVFVIMLSNRLIARYVDTGSMTYILSSPNSRVKIARTQMFFIILSIFAMVTCLVIMGLVAGAIFYPNELNIQSYLLMNVGVFLLHFAIGGFCFFVSCSFDSKKSYLLSVGIPIAFYIFQMLANMGDKLEILKYFTIFTLFDPTAIINGDSYAYVFMGVLFLIGACFYFLAIYNFKKRDLNI